MLDPGHSSDRHCPRAGETLGDPVREEAEGREALTSFCCLLFPVTVPISKGRGWWPWRVSS
jgi:hypothetical protein